MKKALVIANMLFASVSGMENFAQITRERSNINRQLESALLSENIKQVVQSIDEGADINVRLSNEKTPLTFAVSKNNYDWVSILIGLGADVNLKDGNDETPLTISIHNRQDEILDMLLQNENINLELPGVWEMSPLGVAMEMDSQEVDLHNADPLQLKMTRKLLQAGANADGIADVDHQDSALMRAVMYRNKSMVGLLLKHGADINAKNRDGDTALSLASRQGIIDMVKQLVNPKQREIIRLLNARKNRDASAFTDDQLAFLQAAVNINEQNNNGYTSLMSALEAGQPQMAEYLINQGVDINLRNKSGRTALMFAAREGFTEIVNLLLSKGARADLTDKYGQSALQLAEERGHTDIVEILRGIQ